MLIWVLRPTEFSVDFGCLFGCYNSCSIFPVLIWVSIMIFDANWFSLVIPMPISMPTIGIKAEPFDTDLGLDADFDTRWMNFKDVISFRSLLESFTSMMDVIMLGCWTIFSDAAADVGNPYVSAFFFYSFKVSIGRDICIAVRTRSQCKNRDTQCGDSAAFVSVSFPFLHTRLTPTTPPSLPPSVPPSLHPPPPPPPLLPYLPPSLPPPPSLITSAAAAGANVLLRYASYARVHRPELHGRADTGE